MMIFAHVLTAVRRRIIICVRFPPPFTDLCTAVAAVYCQASSIDHSRLPRVLDCIRSICTPLPVKAASYSLSLLSGSFGKGALTSSKKKKAHLSSLLLKSYKPFLSLYDLSSGTSIELYIDLRLFKDPSTMMNTKDRIRLGDIQIILNAFVSDFSKAMYRDLDLMNVYNMNERYFDDGYGFRHKNVYSSDDFSPLFKEVNYIFG